MTTSTKPPSLDSRLSSERAVLASRSGETLLLLHASTGEYFTLDAVGARIWSLCDGSMTVSEIVDLLQEEYEAPRRILEPDVLALVSELAEARLLRPT